MKKQVYTAPSTNVVRVEIMSMIASTTTVSMGINAEEITDADDLLSRESVGLWDDDEE